MKKLVKLVRISSKEAFLKLRALGPIHVQALGESFVVTNLFLRHISGNATKRGIEEIIFRLSSINMIERICKNGELIEIRSDVIIEGNKKFSRSYKIRYEKSKIEFFIILGEKKNGDIILMSIFMNFL